MLFPGIAVCERAAEMVTSEVMLVTGQWSQTLVIPTWTSGNL